MRASFSPVPVPDGVGNGVHVHFSVARAGEALLRLPNAEGESILAGVLTRLPALTGLTAPGVLSKLRLVPQRWAGAYQCWGVENREAALRLIQGGSPNAELKCVDGAANPYLVVAAVAAIVTASVGAGLTLPPPVQQDPDFLADKPPRLPVTVDAGLAALAADPVLVELLGPELLDAFATVHRAEAERCAGLSPEQVAEAVRWRY
jgi:glutamine synthetase